MPASNTRGPRFQLTLYMTLHPDAAVTPRAVASWLGMSRRGACVMLAEMLADGTVRRLSRGVYGRGADLERTLKTLRTPIPPVAWGAMARATQRVSA